MVFGKKIMVIIELRKAFFALQMLMFEAIEFRKNGGSLLVIPLTVGRR